jgi:hypothetical protein
MIEMTNATPCGTCHCDRRWHFTTYDGQIVGCTRKIGMSLPLPCHCTGFMLTESESLRAAYEAEKGRLLFRAAVARQDHIDGAKYRASLDDQPAPPTARAEAGGE